MGFLLGILWTVYRHIGTVLRTKSKLRLLEQFLRREADGTMDMSK